MSSENGELVTLLINQTGFSQKLLNWWIVNQRKFPWRETQNPYQVLIAEVLLHRTKAAQVVPVYERFIREFPTIRDLSNASLCSVHKIVQPLGLHWRTESLHRMATEIMAKYGETIPSETEALEALPGVSQYIASAVRCFAFNKPEVLLDTNTVRILGRVFGKKVTDGSRRSRFFMSLYESLIDRRNPRQFNFAMIDLGAKICTPRRPLCNICPTTHMCDYGKEIGAVS